MCRVRSNYYVKISRIFIMSIITTITNCRICNNTNLTDVIDLGNQIITSRFPLYGDNSTPKTPIILCHCSQCGLLQLRQTTNPCELYEYEYGYRSGLNNTMRAHLKQYHDEILTKVSVKPGDTIIDIGSNDATMLKYWSSSYRRIGVDPTGEQFKQHYCDADGENIELISDYFTAENMRGIVEKGTVKVVSSISMFYDLPDPVKFAKDIYEILADDGIWTCEQSYLITMLKRNSIDTICHEHLEYYALTQIKEIADRAGFNIIDVLFNDCNGGSFRIYFSKKSSGEENSPIVDQIMCEERDYGIMSCDLYKKFIQNCQKEVERLKHFIETVNKNNKRVYIYGASTKGNCLLQFAEIGEKHIKYAVERNPSKVGKMTSTGIEIISEETMRTDPPNYLLVLPWHFREEIIAREHDFLENGGQFIFPFPHFELYGARSRVLITGCDGYISKYVIDLFYEKAALYGISRGGGRGDEKCRDILTFEMDLLDTSKLENTICTIKPHVIIHLAGISSAYEALCNPIASLQTNGMLVANICDILYRNNMRETRLFNSSSSEMYKGHIDFDVRAETIKNTYHLHPYSIAKIMGTSIVDFYRETHNMPFSNGILFTVESSQKSPHFLLNKIAVYLKSERNEPLVLGSLNSWRNIVHAKDAARAIYIISMDAPPDNYIICNKHSVKMFDIVFELFAKFGVILREGEPGKFYDIETGKFVLHVSEKPGFEEQPINIRGYCSKLYDLGWTVRYSIDDILSEICQYGGGSAALL